MTTHNPVRLHLPWVDAIQASEHLGRTDPHGQLAVTREVAHAVQTRQRFCVWCEKPIILNRSHKRFCSSKCRAFSWVEQHGKREG